MLIPSSPPPWVFLLFSRKGERERARRERGSTRVQPRRGRVAITGGGEKPKAKTKKYILYNIVKKTNKNNNKK
jgi:hypothetical protein